jgi:hypothetical protein
MKAIGGRSFEAVYQGLKGAKSVLQLRMIELLTFFVIVFAARQIASFTLQTSTFLIVFLGAALLQIGGQYLFELARERYELSGARTNAGLLWYSSTVDLCVVITIIYLTGTIESPFLFLLVVPLFFVSHIFSWRITVMAFLVGTLTTVATLAYLELAGSIPHFNCYDVDDIVYTNPHYLIGSLLVLGGFLSLVVFLSNAFQDHFHASIDTLRRRDRETKDKMQELSRLYDISLGINAVMTVETLLKMVAKEVTILLSQPWATIVLFNQQREVTHSASVGVPEEYRYNFGPRVREGGFSEFLLEHNQPIVVEDLTLDRRSHAGEFPAASNIRSFIGLPLSTGQHVSFASLP